MDNYPAPQQQCFQMVNTDELIDLLNENSAPYNAQHFQMNCEQHQTDQFQVLDRQEESWIIGIQPENFEMKFDQVPFNPFFEPQIHNPPQQPLARRTRGREQRCDSLFGAQMVSFTEQAKIEDPKNKQNKEEEIIKQNQELFKANQSKSIYLSKISTLIDRTFQSSTQTSSPKSPTQIKIQSKIARKASNGPRDSESSSDLNDPQQVKLAKNRESARNSRKRKKVYVELLENKVQELQSQVNKLEQICQSQKKYIEQCQNMHSKVELLYASELQMTEELAKSIQLTQPLDQVISKIDQTIGVTSEPRSKTCQYFLQNLINFSQTPSIKGLIDQVLTETGLFSPLNPQMDNLRNLQRAILETALHWQQNVQNFFDHYNSLVLHLLDFEKLEKQLIYSLGEMNYANFVLSLTRDTYFSDEKSDSLSDSVKLEDLNEDISSRKQVKKI